MHCHRPLLIAFILLLTGSTLAQVYENQADSSSRWCTPDVGPACACAGTSNCETASGLTFSTTDGADTNGDATPDCTGATIIDAATDWAEIECYGTVCDGIGDRVPSVTISWWYKATGTPGSYCRMMDLQGSGFRFRRYGAAGNVFRWEDTTTWQVTNSTGIDPWDGGWHQWVITWHNATGTTGDEERRFYIDGTLVGSDTQVLFGWGGLTKTAAEDLVFGNDEDKVTGGCTGLYDEIQISQTFADLSLGSGPGCAGAGTDAINATVSDSHAFGATFHTGGTTCSCACDYKVRLKRKYGDVNSATINEWTYTSGTTADVGTLWPNRYEGGSTGLRPGYDVACDGLDSLAGCNCCNWQTPCGEVDPGWGVNWMDPSPPALQADRWDNDADGVGDGIAGFRTHRGRSLFADDFTRPFNSDRTVATNLDGKQLQWAPADNNCGVSSACPIIASPGVASFGGLSFVHAAGKTLLPPDQFVVAYIDCPSCSTATQDHVLQLRRDASGSNLYQCKFEFFGGTSASVKWNATIGGTPRGACADYTTPAGIGDSLPLWARCEAWTDDADGDGLEEVHLGAWMATGASPGAWQHASTLVIEDNGAGGSTLTCYAPDGTPAANCAGAGSGCSTWPAATPYTPSEPTAFAIGLDKSGTHTFDELIAGALTSAPQSRRRSP